jgi:O-6-methylguanine DNA methyltransferase
MHVALDRQIPSPASLMREPLLLRHPAGLCPSAEYFLATIPTKWGACGAVCKYRDSGSRSNFAERPTHALLCKIITPGLTISELRKQVMSEYRICDEVYGDGHGNFHPEVVPEWFGQLVRFLQGYYANTMRGDSEWNVVEHWGYWEPRLEWGRLTDFQRRVLQLVARIERGGRRTYGEIARLLGSPKASRAVGAAVGANPWPVLVPCHRVVGAGGKMTGFSAPGGVKVKVRMLEMESGGLFG